MSQGNGRSRVALLGISLMVALSGCGGGGGSDEPAPPVTPSWTVSASASGPGTITPASSTVKNGETAVFTVTPDQGNLVQQVTGCGGTLSGSTYTTGPVTEACTVTATFSMPYTISGTVSGLAWGYGLILHNSTDTVTVSTNGTFTFPVGIANGANYSVTVEDPSKMKCTVTNGTGTVDGAHVTNIEVTCKDAVTALYPANGANWNDYVKNDGADVRSASDTACVGDETGGYSACIHGGERRVLAVSGAQSCLGLTATDALDAFDWRCDESKGYVRFVSSRLKYNKKLSDLIDFTASAWKENVVVVKNGATTVATSASTQWWSNPLSVKNYGMTSATAGTIYLVTADAQGSYLLDADKVGLVIHPGKLLGGPGTNSSVVATTSHKYLWLEGRINALQDDYGMNMSGMYFSVLRGVQITNASKVGLYLGSSHNNSLSRLVMANYVEKGIQLSSSSNNILAAITAVQGSSGIYIYQSHDNVFREVVAANNTVSGVQLSLSNNGFVASVVSANSGSTGLGQDGGKWLRFADIATINNDVGVWLENSVENVFTGLLRLGNRTFDCKILGGTNPGLAVVDGACTVQGYSVAALTTGYTLANSFAGKVSADTLNASDINGTADYPAGSSLFEWWLFDNEYRAWGTDGSAFPSSDHRGPWTTGTGRIWDWSAKTGDTVIKDVLTRPTGNDTHTHTWSDGTTTTFLRHAQEVDGDADGLCESNETCLYTANIGAYQGHGNLYEGTFTDGYITGVKLLQYQYNGR